MLEYNIMYFHKRIGTHATDITPRPAPYQSSVTRPVTILKSFIEFTFNQLMRFAVKVNLWHSF